MRNQKLNQYNYSLSRIHNSDKSGGFTLVEILVSMTIFAVMTTAVVANFRASQFSSELRLGTEEVAQKIRTLRNMAQTGVAVNLCGTDALDDAGKVCESGADINCPDYCAARVPRGGYGIHISDGAIVAFADGYGVTEAGISPNYAYDEDEMLQSVRLELPAQLSVSSAETPLTITFAPPQGEIWINGAQIPEETETRIIIQHRRTGQERIIVVRRISGRIEVE